MQSQPTHQPELRKPPNSSIANDCISEQCRNNAHIRYWQARECPDVNETAGLARIRVLPSNGSLAMNRTRFLTTLCLLAIPWSLLGGCASVPDSLPKTVGNDTSEIDTIAAALDQPQAEVFADVHSGPPVTASTVKDLSSYSYREMSLSEVMNNAMQHSQVLIELGGTVLRNPAALKTQFAQ